MAPHSDTANGGLRAGVAEDFPNGGGNRGFLFVVDGPQGRFSWFFQNSASAVDLQAPIVIDGKEGGTGAYWFLAFVMAFFWFGSTLMYGIAKDYLGSWGTTLAWPMFMSLIVITASLLGILTGEWKSSGRKPLQIQLAGVAVLVMAVFVLSAASRWV